jgi:17beta-estradiol 17-dehydrogenase / very-long-chain 3-oxoacyl-CoA reductase
MAGKRLLDPKVRNLLIFVVNRTIGAVVLVKGFLYVTGETDPARLFGLAVLAIIGWRVLLMLYRRLVVPGKHPLAYGKWAIVTGSTSGIGKEFAEHFAKIGMSVLLVSRSEDKLNAQATELCERFKVDCDYLVYDFGGPQEGKEKKDFYKKLDKKCDVMTKDGGIGILVNNVGTANEIPKRIEEFTDEDVTGMINCNIHSLLWMTRTVSKHMKAKNNGCVISISSGSGNAPAPFLAVYSATKAFMTQFTRSMHIENWDTGVDFLVVTPFYVVSNLYKRTTGTLIAPLPDVLVRGTLCQLGKKYVPPSHLSFSLFFIIACVARV